MLPEPDRNRKHFMSPKIREFTVSAFLPTTPPFIIGAHSKFQLARRLGSRLSRAPESLEDVADALWRGKPVFLTDLQLVVLLGRSASVSYQTLTFR
jgi:hypothetical protein